MIRLEGLTRHQVQLCDQLWECESESDIQELIRELSAEDARELATLQTMILQEAMEEQLEQMQYYPDAEAVVARAQQKRG